MRLSSFLLTLTAVQRVVCSDHEVQAKAKRVAIIGAGAAGTSAAHHLRKYASTANIPLNITIYEQSSYIGGRSTTVQAFNDSASRPVELGASIFVGVNYVLQDAAEEFGLSKVDPYGADSVYKLAAGADGEDISEAVKEKLPFMGVYDGDSMVVKMEDSGWWSGTKMLWRYGLAPYYSDRLMKKTVAKFLKIYESPYFPFASLTKRVYDLDLHETVATTADAFYKINGIGDAFVNEVIQAMTRVNYAQNIGSIHGLEGIVSISTNGAVAIEGGNWKMFDAMAKASNADIRLNTRVMTITRHKDGTFTINAKKDITSENTEAEEVDFLTEDFDSVILAAPYQYTKINVSPKPRIVPDEIPYVNLHVTLFTSPHYLSGAAFNLPGDEMPPRMLLTTVQPEERPGADPFYKSKVDFNSISLLGTRVNPSTKRDEYLYKIFSMSSIPDSFLANILGVKTDKDGAVSEKDVSWVYRKLWQSYPYEIPRVTFEELRLDQNLWYTGGMESFISCMETSGLMGKNVAKLVVEEWIGAKEHAQTYVVPNQVVQDPELVQEALNPEL